MCTEEVGVGTTDVVEFEEGVVEDEEGVVEDEEDVVEDGEGVGVVDTIGLALTIKEALGVSAWAHTAFEKQSQKDLQVQTWVLA